jgi:hypothetical protein
LRTVFQVVTLMEELMFRTLPSINTTTMTPACKLWARLGSALSGVTPICGRGYGGLGRGCQEPNRSCDSGS